MKKLLLMLMVFCMLFGTMAGCTQGSGTPDNGQSNNGGASDKSGVPSFSINLPFAQAYTDQPRVQEINERFGVNVEWINLPGEPWNEEYANKLKLLCGDDSTMPDVIVFMRKWMATEFEQWKKAELILDLAPYLKDMPDFVTYYNDTYGMKPVFTNFDNGTLYALPADVVEPGARYMVARSDFLEHFGYEGGGTLDDFTDFLRKCTKEDPDGNGMDDTFGISGNKNDLARFYQFFSAYKASPMDEDWIIQDDGTIKWGPVCDGAKDALGILAKLYADGIIDPNLVTGGKDEWSDILPAGTAATINQTCWALTPSCGPANQFAERHPGVTYDKIDPPTGPYGFGSDYEAAYTGDLVFAVTTKCKCPEAALKFMNDMMTPENCIWLQFGEHGVDYDQDDNGDMYFLEDAETRNQKGIGMTLNLCQRKDEYNIENTKRGIGYMQDTAERTSLPCQEMTVAVTDLTLPNMIKYQSELMSLRDMYYWGIITGERPVDDFDEFVSRYYEMGGTDVEREANGSYQSNQAQYVVFEQWMDDNLDLNGR